MDVAIFGGSFDPFHIGHEKIVSLALNELKISKLFIVPTYLNPFKNSSFLNANTRLELIQEIYEDTQNIKIIDYEVNKEKKIPTIQSVKYLKNKFDLKTIYLIIGADNLKDIHLWYNFENLKQLVKFVIISRDKIMLKNDNINAIYLNFDENISSTSLRKNMELKFIPKKIQQKVKELWKI